MKIFRYPDASESYYYENGDLVKVIKGYKGSVDTEVGEWGVIRLRDRKDRKQGFSGHISHVSIQTAGVSTPKDSFFQCISSIPVWDIMPMDETYKNAEILEENID